MIHWAWLIPTFIIGAWLGSFGDKTSRGFGFGIVATLLALIGLS
jgi:predicted branched-subunit amino acid permease